MARHGRERDESLRNWNRPKFRGQFNRDPQKWHHAAGSTCKSDDSRRRCPSRGLRDGENTANLGEKLIPLATRYRGYRRGGYFRYGRDSSSNF